jgi:hypothetical protein
MEIQYQITPEGFRTLVVSCMTREVGEHYTEIREGSLLELADEVARRCIALSEEREVAREAIVFLEDRRVLYSPYEVEMPHHVVRRSSRSGTS